MDNMIDRAIKQTRKEAHALEIKEYKEDYLNLLDANDYLGGTDELAELFADIKQAYNENDGIALENWQVELLKNFIDSTLR